MDEKVVLVRARVLLMRASVDLMKARKSSLKSKNSSTLHTQRRLSCHTPVQMKFISRRWSSRIEVQPNVYLCTLIIPPTRANPFSTSDCQSGPDLKMLLLSTRTSGNCAREERSAALIVQDAGLEL